MEKKPEVEEEEAVEAEGAEKYHEKREEEGEKWGSGDVSKSLLACPAPAGVAKKPSSRERQKLCLFHLFFPSHPWHRLPETHTAPPVARAPCLFGVLFLIRKRGEGNVSFLFKTIFIQSPTNI